MAYRSRNLDTPYRRHKRQSNADQSLVNRMTNWQRQQWARAGYPEKDGEVQRFLEMKRVTFDEFSAEARKIGGAS